MKTGRINPLNKETQDFNFRYQEITMGSLFAINQQQISHEFNTALTGILHNAAMLREQTLSTQQKTACLQDIYHTSEVMLTFINSLLNAAKQAMLAETDLNDNQVSVPAHENHTDIQRNHWLSVLLVEDEPIIQRVHSKMLQSLGCGIDIASDGYQALEKLNGSHRYDVIFMDIGLPGMSGIQAVEKIRQQPIYQSIPVIGLTAYQLDEIRGPCQAAGFNQLIAKPISLKDLKSILLKLAKVRIQHRFV